MSGKTIKLCLVGYGNIGSSHCERIARKETKNTDLAAICDTNPAKLAAAREKFGDAVKYYESIEAAILAGGFDSVLVSTPHYSHPDIAIKSFEAGMNVLVEKPVCVYTSAAKRINEAAQKSGKVFALMYNQRTNPMYQKLREMIMSGELGKIKRMVWLITSWYRSQSYYDSGGWRATWGGEGGGVLLNQDPHQLDLWWWLCGMPKRIYSFAYEGVCRNIEVENDVTAFAEYEDNMTALFVTSTHETPGTNRLEISADMGKVVVENDRIVFTKNKIGETEFNNTWTKGFGEPGCEEIIIEPDEPVDYKLGHAGIISDFASAILFGTPLLSPGYEGINGLSISNAIHLSAWTGGWVDPANIDEALFERILSEKIKNSRADKKDGEVILDTEGTY